MASLRIIRKKLSDKRFFFEEFFSVTLHTHPFNLKCWASLSNFSIRLLIRMVLTIHVSAIIMAFDSFWACWTEGQRSISFAISTPPKVTGTTDWQSTHPPAFNAFHVKIKYTIEFSNSGMTTVRKRAGASVAKSWDVIHIAAEVLCLSFWSEAAIAVIDNLPNYFVVLHASHRPQAHSIQNGSFILLHLHSHPETPVFSV